MRVRSHRGLGVGGAVAAFAADQGHKWWMLGPFDIAGRQPVRLGPHLDLVLVWNQGVSYGWFSSTGQFGRWFLVSVMLVVVAVLAIWLMRTNDRLSALSLGLLIGGALGNILDRIVHGAVADFFFFHIGDFSWYVFNLADAAIVAGVIGLLYSSWTVGGRTGETKASDRE